MKTLSYLIIILSLATSVFAFEGNRWFYDTWDGNTVAAVVRPYKMRAFGVHKNELGIMAFFNAKYERVNAHKMHIKVDDNKEFSILGVDMDGTFMGLLEEVELRQLMYGEQVRVIISLEGNRQMVETFSLDGSLEAIQKMRSK